MLQSELIANETTPIASKDPRAAAALAEPLVGEGHDAEGLRAVLVHHTRSSGLRMASAIDHLVEGPEGTTTTTSAYPDAARDRDRRRPGSGQAAADRQAIAYGWSGPARGRRCVTRSRPRWRPPSTPASRACWPNSARTSTNYWDRADVEIEGDPELQQAIRFALWHTLQAGARGEQRAIAAKGLTGPGYDGHTFWDTEMFVLPVLTYTVPHAAADALRWRQQTLELARERARDLGLRGAAFPWRTIEGHECSGYWPAGTAAFHINADIARAVTRYQWAADDPDFEHGTGAELLVETARLWRSLGHHDAAGKFRIDGVTGPDEYSAVADNNIYTNLMAAANLTAAAAIVERHPKRAVELGVDAEEAAGWRDAAAR